MKTHRIVILFTALLVPVLPGAVMADTAHGPACDRRLVVELTPDVPDPRDAAFLSSLLSNEVEYRLIFRGEAGDSAILLELLGPGPAYRCQEVIQSMRKDGRVLSIRPYTERSDIVPKEL